MIDDASRPESRKANACLLIVEDDPAMVELLRWTFEAKGFRVTATGSGEDALSLAKAGSPDIILLDWMIHEIAGIDVCRRLRRLPETAAIPIIMVTARTGERDRLLAFEAGADDVVLKPFGAAELVARTRAVMRRNRPAAPASALSFEDLELDLAGHKARRSGELIPLTSTEFRLLAHLMQSPRRVFSRDSLVDAIWGRGGNVDARAVDALVARLRRALDAGGRPGLIRTLRSTGYALGEEGET